MTRVAEENTIETAVQPAAVSRKKLWIGGILSAIPILLLIFSGVMKLVMPPSVALGFAHFGLPLHIAAGLGIVEICCAVVYAIPRVAVLGAILMTGYLGGAAATNVRVGDSFVVPVLLGVLVWGGLFLRDWRIRALIPLKS